MPMSMPMPIKLTATFWLLTATLFWGWTFPVVKDTVALIHPYMILVIRFGAGAIILFTISKFFPSKPSAKLPKLKFKQALIISLLLFLIFAAQTYGLVFTSATNSAFITGLNIIWVALIAAIVSKRIGMLECLCILLAVSGLGLLTDLSTSDWQFNIGDGLTLVCSLMIALHIIALDRWAENVDSMHLTIFQLVAVAIFSLLAFSAEYLWLDAQFSPSILLEPIVIANLALLTLGATVIAFFAQTKYQPKLNALSASLIFVMEPIFAALFTYFFYDATFSIRSLSGASLMFCAMLISVIFLRKQHSKHKKQQKSYST